ncbi:MAG: hypothetical protein WBF04_22665 [Candidatus Sulfotelmatobacter sp.]
MSTANFEVLNQREVSVGSEERTGGWRLWFQWGQYRRTDNNETERGYRFIWQRPEADGGSMQSRPPLIHSAAQLFELLRLASDAGWFGVCEHEATPEESVNAVA